MSLLPTTGGGIILPAFLLRIGTCALIGSYLSVEFHAGFSGYSTGASARTHTTRRRFKRSVDFYAYLRRRRSRRIADSGSGPVNNDATSQCNDRHTVSSVASVVFCVADSKRFNVGWLRPNARAISD